MGIVLNSILFLLRRAPEIYVTGKVLTRSIRGMPALTGADPVSALDGGGRIGAIEQELRVLNEERDRLSGDLGRLSNEVAMIGIEVERARKSIRLLVVLFALFVLTGLFLAAVVLSRFP